MNRSLQNRLKRLEGGNDREVKVVEIQAGTDEEEEQQIARLRADGEIAEDQLVVVLRSFAPELRPSGPDQIS